MDLLNLRGRFHWELFVIFLHYGSRLPLFAFHFLPSHTPVDEEKKKKKVSSHTHRATHTRIHKHLLSTRLLSHSPCFIHTYKGPTVMHSKKKKKKHKLFPSHCNMKRRVHTASHLDVTALPGLLYYIKNSTPIIVKATNRWRRICLALAEVMWKLLFFFPFSPSFFLSFSLGLF